MTHARSTFDALGRCASARQVASPNSDARPDDRPPELLVVHGISLPPGEFGGDSIERLFTNRLDPAAHPYFETIAALRVSAHFVIRRDGELIQFVPCSARAWHAGVSSWRGRATCNDYSIGVELEGVDDVPYDERQYAALAELARQICLHYPIEAIVGHEHIAPGRKTDPGPAFDWLRFERESALGKERFDDVRALAQD
ncbi:1,6-anhydro-N-acetylmuramyl-L-alanine amidase AmpD [soil metagenome]